MKKRPNSRRDFLKKSALTGLGAAIGMQLAPPFVFAEAEVHRSMMEKGSLTIHPRYHRWHVDPGVDWLETNTGYATLDWTVPVSQTALVLLDVWQRHYIKDTEARGEKIIQEKLVPLLAECRKHHLPVIHAPSPPVARIHPNWVNLVNESEASVRADNWPPREFLTLTGPYNSYRRPFEPREAEKQSLPPLRIHPDTKPLKNEAVVATGEELHRYCKKNGILFLLFAGFNTNACILSRDYGVTQMSARGYQVALVRDCTTGMETKETQPTLSQTNGAILILEMFGQYSVTSDDIIKGFSA